MRIGLEPRAGPQAAGVEARATATPAGALAGHVLALQQSAGNTAVRGLLRQRRPARDSVREPYARFSMEVQRAGRGRFVPFRGDELFVGDRLVVRASIHRLADSTQPVSARLLACYAGLAVERERLQGDTYELRLRAVAPSRGGFRLAIAMSGGVQQLFEHTLRVAWDADVRAWQKRLDDAEDRLEERFSAAKGKVLQARRAFNDAYNQHEAELARVDANEQIDNFLLYVLLVFALGSFPSRVGATVTKAVIGDAAASTAVGSGVVAMVGGFAEGAVADVYYLLVYAADSPGAPTGPGLTEPGQGATAYLSRMLGRPGYTTANDPTFKILAPVLTDPRSFGTNLEGALWREKARLDGQLAHMTAGLDAEAARSSRVRSYEDPVAWASRPNILLDTLATRLETDFNSYYEALWGAWVRLFYYRVALVPYTGPAALGGSAAYEVRPRRDVDAVLDSVVKRLGKSEFPDRQAFLDKYGDRAGKAAEAASR